MTDVVDVLRSVCARIAERSRQVSVVLDAIPAYAASLPPPPNSRPDPSTHLPGSREQRAAFWLTLDAINFGSGWFPTLRKRPGQSGYGTIAAGLRDRFQRQGAWSAAQLARLEPAEIAAVTGQDPTTN